jgi:hypothetical protein
MPKVSGIFDLFKDLDQIPVENISRWIKPTPEVYFLENYLANRIIYPQSIPSDEKSLDLDLAILREGLKSTPEYYNKGSQRIFIPEGFISRFPNIKKLVWAFIDAYELSDINKVVLLKPNYQEVLGTVVSLKFNSPKGGVAKTTIEEKPYEIKQGSLMILSCLSSHCHMTFKSNHATLLGKKDLTFEAFGGELGIFIDARGVS